MTTKIPKHIAIIMDGNGRWAKRRGKPRSVGHQKGSETLEDICKDVYDLGIKYLTVYAFSTENWKRPKEEVDYLMQLMKKFLKDSVKNAKKNNMRVRVIGRREDIPSDVKDRVFELEDKTKNLSGLNLQIAFSYGSRDELVRAIKRIVEDINLKNIEVDDISEKILSEYLDTKDIPEPDLLIRPGGEKRLSNFLMYQMAYTELYFTDVLWPDFDKNELLKAISFYSKSERRFGGIKDEN